MAGIFLEVLSVPGNKNVGILLPGSFELGEIAPKSGRVGMAPETGDIDPIQRKSDSEGLLVTLKVFSDDVEGSDIVITGKSGILLRLLE